MPSKSQAQRNFMRMCASAGGRANAKGRCPPQKVAREYVRADKAIDTKRTGRIRNGGKRFD